MEPAAAVESIPEVLDPGEYGMLGELACDVYEKLHPGEKAPDDNAEKDDEHVAVAEKGTLEKDGLSGAGTLTFPDPADAVEAFFGWTEDCGIKLWPHQEDAMVDLASGDHVILGTPTGSGKSMVALALHFMALATGRRSYYTAPIKALVSQKFFELVDLFGRDNVGMITGDSQINVNAPVICCTAEILANQALREGEDTPVEYVTMDEFHYYADADRGWAWQVPLLTLPHAQFLLMSATLGDVSQIARLLEDHTGISADLVLDAPRPVPLAFEYVDTPLEATVEIALRKGQGPIYVVHFAQEAALASAQSLASYGVTLKEQREDIREALKGAQFNTAFGKILKRLLLAGVGVHHAGMLPRYRLAVEKLAQRGLLPVICGTDTLGVGINVPIHTVLLTQLTKFDGKRMRRLHSREFHQIAGRAGRAGFDTEGMVIAEAPPYEIENAKILSKAGDDPKKQRRIKRKKPPENFVNWSKQTFERLISAPPETLRPRLRITHSMVLAEVQQGGDARARVRVLIEESAQPLEEKVKLQERAAEIFSTLILAGVVMVEADEDGSETYSTTVDLPDNFALDQPLSPFLLEALDLLDPESETYAHDVVSMVEATLEDPRQILRVQERRAKDSAMAAMKAEGVEYEERLERIADITYCKPLEDLLNYAFDKYCEGVPWARDYVLRPKSVLRDMLEKAADFKGYISSYGLARSEGTLLRYLSDAYRVLARTIPEGRLDERLRDIISWLGLVVRSVDSSLIDEWSQSGSGIDSLPPEVANKVVHDRRGLIVLVRNALFARVKLAAHDDARSLGELDVSWGYNARRWREVLDAYYREHGEMALDADARSMRYLSIDEADENTMHVWHTHQIFADPEGDRDFGIVADVDLDATQQGDGVVFSRYRAGSFEELRED